MTIDIISLRSSTLVIWIALLTLITEYLLHFGARKNSYIPFLPYNHKAQLISWEPEVLLGWTESPIPINT